MDADELKQIHEAAQQFPKTTTIEIPLDFSQGACDSPHPESPEVTCRHPVVNGDAYHLLFGGHAGMNEAGEYFLWPNN